MDRFSRNHNTTPRANTFPLLSLPPELRSMVYSYIILPPHQSTPRIKTDRNMRATKHYYQQRRLCHDTAHSLLRINRQINQEITWLLYRHKTVVLSKPSQLCTMHLNTGLNDELNWMTPQHIHHLEFNLEMTQSDIDNGLMLLRQHLAAMSCTLNKHIRRLPNLQSVTFKIVHFTTKTNLSYLPLFFGLDIKAKDDLCLLAHMPSRSTSWEIDQLYGVMNVDHLVREAAAVHQYADGLGYGPLRWDEWEVDKKVFKSSWRAVVDFFMHEMKFTRINGARVRKEEEEMQNEARLDCDKGIIQEFLDDYDANGSMSVDDKEDL